MSTPINSNRADARLAATRSEPASVSPGLLRRFPAAFATFLATWARRAERNAAVRELRMLDDSMLKDIGLYRGDIWYVADAASRGIDVRKAADTKTPKPILRPMPADTNPPANDNRGRPVPAIMSAGRA